MREGTNGYVTNCKIKFLNFIIEPELLFKSTDRMFKFIICDQLPNAHFYEFFKIVTIPLTDGNNPRASFNLFE